MREEVDDGKEYLIHMYDAPLHNDDEDDRPVPIMLTASSS